MESVQRIILTVVAFVITAAQALAQAPPVPDNGWIFSEQDGLTAAPTFGDATGTLSGGVDWDAEDPFGGAGSVSFDGSDGTVVMEDLSTVFNGLSNFSLSIWVKANDTGIDKGFWEAVDSGGGDLWGLRYDSTGATAGGSNVINLGITTSESGGNTNRGGDQQETRENVQTIEWQNLVMTWEDGVGFNLYIDGILDEPTSAMVTTSGTLSDMDRFVLGDGAKAYWDGYIDEVAVWTSTLTAENAAWLAKNSIAGLGGVRSLEEGLIGYWPFDDQAGTTADLSESKNDGTVNGEPEWVTGHTGGAGDSAIKFDGQDDSVTTAVSLLNDFPELTLSLWLLMPEQQPGNRIGLIGQNDAVEYGMINPTTMQYWTPAGSINVNYGPTVEEWTHVAVVVNEDGFKVYSNGEVVGEAGGGGPVNSGDTFNMGGDGIYDTSGNFFLGSMDDVAVWNIALSEDDIQDLASGDAAPIARGRTEVVPGLIAYWPFDGNLDDSVGDSHGTGMGSADIEFSEGQFGEGIDLDGVDQYVETPIANEEMFDFQDGTGFSMSAWFRVDAFTKSWQALIAKGEGNRWRVHRRGGESVMTGNGGNGDVPQGPTDVLDAQIHHLVLVSDPENDEVRFYVDGELEASNTGPAIQSNDNPMMIGENPDARNRTWDGLIDDVGIWARPISEDEVATIYNGGEGTPLIVGGAATPKPRLSKLVSNASGFSFLIKDVEGAVVDPDSVVVTFDGTIIEVTKSKDDVEGLTSVSYESAELLAPESEHTLSVELMDTSGNKAKLEKEFKVKKYTPVDPSLAVSESIKGESGFLVYPTQISLGGGGGNLHGNDWQSAEKQIRGEYIDAFGELYLNEADPDAWEGWSYYPEIVPWVNQNQDAPGAVGNFNVNNGYEDEWLNGIPGWGDSTDGIASEYIALLELEKGSYKFGVNSDDGFSASIGANFSDALGQQLGLFNGSRGAADTTFEFYIAEAGLYPYRVSWWEGGSGANIEIFSFVNGEKVLINDPDVEGSVMAYTIKGAVVDESTTEHVSTGRPYIVTLSPAQGAVAKGGIKVVAKNDSDSITTSSVKLSVNGEAVVADVSVDGGTVTITYEPEGGLPLGESSATLSYDESNGKSRSSTWEFKVPKYYTPSGPAPAEALGLVSITEWHGVGNGNMSGYTHAKFPDSPDYETLAGYFEWPQSGDPEVPPAADVRNNYFWSIRGYFYPPETGEYRFYSATDDNNELFLSTDETSANARMIARETGWHAVRDYQAVGDEATSGMVLLEEGKPYYLELITSEGGGGDNAALAVVFPSEEDREAEDGEAPLLGKYLSPFLMTVPDAVDLVITEQPSDATAEKNTTAQFSIGLSHDVGQVFWKLNGDVVGQGLVFTTPELGDEHDGAKVQAIVIYNGAQLSDEATLTVTPDTTAPGMVSSSASRYMDTLSLTFDEDMDAASAGKASNYSVAGLSVDSAELVGRMVVLSTGEQTPGTVYTVSVSGVADPAGNAFNGDVNIKAYIEATGFLWWDVWKGIGGAHPMENLTDDPRYPDNPDTSQLLPWTNTRWATGYHNDGNADYGARASGWLVAPEDGEYRFWLRSDDHGQVWISMDEDPANVELIAEETGCCKGFTLDDGGLSGIVELEAGQRYYFEALLKEGGGGDWMNVGWTRPLDPDFDAPPWNDGGISGEHFVNYIPGDGSAFTGDAEIYRLGTQSPASGGGGLLVREFQEIGGARMGDLLSNAKWPNAPDLVTWSSHAEWPENGSGDINDLPAGNVQDNCATHMLGFVHPPETGEYQFFVAADDATVLFLSTDETPSNKRLIALEPNWNGVREFGQGRNRVVVDVDSGRMINGSAPIALEAGKAYFMEAITKEGGGGDNLAITWIRAGDELPADGALPIAGEHLSPWIEEQTSEPPAISIARNGDGAVTITFEGKLQTALTVNGPWTDSGETSPVTVSPDEAMLFGRAVNE